MRLGIVGFGSAGGRHMAHARAHGDHEFQLCDPLCGVATYVVGAEALWKWRPDAVIIASPWNTHLGYVQRAVAEGIPFLVEKPLGTLEERPAWRALAEGPLPIHQVGYHLRFHPVAAFLRRHVVSLDQRQLRMWCWTDMATWPGRTYGPPLLECSHDLDLALWWLGGDAGALHEATVRERDCDIHCVFENLTMNIRWASDRYFNAWYVDGVEFLKRIRDEPISRDSPIYYATTAAFLDRVANPGLPAGDGCTLPEALRVLDYCALILDHAESKTEAS